MTCFLTSRLYRRSIVAINQLFLCAYVILVRVILLTVNFVKLRRAAHSAYPVLLRNVTDRVLWDPCYANGDHRST